MTAIWTSERLIEIEAPKLLEDYPRAKCFITKERTMGTVEKDSQGSRQDIDVSGGDEDIIDLEEHAKHGKTLPKGKRYRIKIDQEKHITVDPIITGRQLLNLAGRKPVKEHLVYFIRHEGLIEDISLEETVDLRTPGLERFITFKSDRSFRFELDGKRQDWGAPEITGATLRKLAGVGADHNVWLELRDDKDRRIKPKELVDLTTPGIERFYTAPKPPPEFEVIVNARPHILAEQTVTYEMVVQLAYPGCQSQGNVTFSMTYRHAASRPHSGELGPGGTVKVKRKGTVFNVVRTIKS